MDIKKLTREFWLQLSEDMEELNSIKEKYNKRLESQGTYPPPDYKELTLAVQYLKDAVRCLNNIQIN
jgi:hypothetical protein